MKFFKFLVILSFFAMVITNEDDDNDKDKTDTKDEKEEKHMEEIDEEHYKGKKKELEDAISEMEANDKTKKDEIDEQKEKLGNIEKRLEFIKEHKAFMDEMEAVKNERDETKDEDSKKELDRIIEAGNKTMEEDYHTIKKLMIEEVEKEKELKKLEGEKETKKEDEMKKEKEKLDETSKKIDGKLEKMDYKSKPRLEVKLEKRIIDQKKLEEKLAKCNSETESNGSSSLDISETTSLFAMFILVKLTKIVHSNSL